MNPVFVARKLLFLLMFFACADLFASSGKATDNAFAALLSMPGSEPATGHWDIPTPDDFRPDSESALIGYLATQQKAGADFNAYRHKGTLLHHAIRAGKTRTAIWLLAHGADPRKTIGGGADDALAVSLTFKRKQLSRLLQDKYGLKTPAQPARSSAGQAPRMAAPDDIGGARAQLAYVAWMGEVVRAPTAVAKNHAEYRQLQANWGSAIASMTPELYASVVDDDKAMSDLAKLHSRSAPELDQALARIPAPIVKRRARAAVAGLAGQARMEIDRKSNTIRYPVPVEVWRTLWRRLGQPLDYADRLGLARDLQPELWPGLLASGYGGRPAQDALGCMLSEIGARDLQAMWPRLVENFPDIGQAAPRMVLANFRFKGRFECYGSDADATRDKLLFLASAGVKAPVSGILKQELGSASPGLLAAMRPFLPSALKGRAAPAPRLVDSTATCTFSLTEPWYRKLLAPTTTMGDAKESRTVDIVTVQLVEIPGETECGLLVGGYLSLDGFSSSVVDTFTGPEYDPIPSCIDARDSYVVWQKRQDKIVELHTDMGDDDGAPLLVPVRDTLTGKRYYLHNGEQYGKCHGRWRLPFTFEWRRAGKEWSLMRTDSEELEEALFDQCGLDEKRDPQCRGIAAIAANGPAAKAPDGFRDTPVAEFVKSFGRDRYRDYLAAIAALDKPTLKALHAAGVPGNWTADAIAQIGDSRQPLAAKRARTAWIFADRAQLARAVNSDVLARLVTWLPREDWRALLDLTAKNPDAYALGSLRETAQDKGDTALACDIDHARGLICGETFGAD